MTDECTVYEGDEGTELIFDTTKDLSTATLVAIDVMRPGETTKKTWVGEVTEVTKVKYKSLAGDLDPQGKYLAMVYVVLPTWSGHGDLVTFYVRRMFE